MSLCLVLEKRFVFILIYVDECFTCMYACALYAIQDTYKIEKATNFLRLELKAVVRYYVGGGK